jgi:hypothetical protein
MADSSAPQIPTTKSHNVQNTNTRGRSFSRKRPLSRSDEVVYLLHVLDRRFLGES